MDPRIKNQGQLAPNFYPILLIAMLVVATLLRLYRLNEGLWLDELLTYVKYAQLPYKEIVTTFDSENQHFLYSLLAHTSFLLFGQSAWALRLPAVLFGVGSIWALYLLGEQVTTRLEALLSAALLTFSYHHVWFSQDARGYSGLLFWALLSSWLLLRGLKEDRLLIWIGYAVAAALGFYTHMTMGFVLVGQFLICLIAAAINYKKKRPYPWLGSLLGFLLAGLLILVLHAPVLPQILHTVGGSEQSVVTAWKNPIWTVLEIFRGLEVGFAGGVVALVALVLFSAGLFSYASSQPALLGLLLFPTSIGAAITLAVGHHLWPRFFFFAIGFGALVIIRGIVATAHFAIRFLRLPVNLSTRLGIALCLALVLISMFSVPFAYGPKQDYAGALQFIEANQQPGDHVVTVSLTDYAYHDFYQTGWSTVTSLEELNQIRARSVRTWLLYTFPPVLESVYPDIMRNIQKDFKVVKIFNGTVESGMIYVCLASSPSVKNESSNNQ